MCVFTGPCSSEGTRVSMALVSLHVCVNVQARLSQMLLRDEAGMRSAFTASDLAGAMVSAMRPPAKEMPTFSLQAKGTPTNTPYEKALVPILQVCPLQCPCKLARLRMRAAGAFTLQTWLGAPQPVVQALPGCLWLPTNANGQNPLSLRWMCKGFVPGLYWLLAWSA